MRMVICLQIPEHVNRWKNYYSQLLNIHRVSEPLVPHPSRFEVENAVAKLKNYKSPSSNQIIAKLIQAGGETLWSVIYKLINSLSSKEELPK
jgi:hypothetical protein